MVLSSRELIQAGRQLEPPFEVDLKISGEVKRGYCLQLLRLVPERRVVVKMMLDEKLYLAKIFLGQSKAKYCKRERSGINVLQNADINTATIQAGATLADGSADILLLEFLPEVKHLSEFVSEKVSEGADYLERALGIMATLHEKGLRHEDCHLDNFLISAGDLYLVDGDAVQQEVELSQTSAMANLALFFVQLPLSLSGRLPQLFVDYCERRGWSEQSCRASFFSEVQKQRENRQRRFLKKVFRDCTLFKVTKSWSRFVSQDRKEESPGLEKLVNNPDAYINKGKLLKDGNSATVALVELEDKAFVVKRYNMKSLVHRLSRFWRPSRAWVSWQNAHLLQFYGVGTPKPLALIERRWGLFRGKAYFISEYIDAENALTYAQNKAAEARAIGILAEKFADLFRTMKLLHLTHGDFKATNFLLNGDSLSVIDLDSMMLHTSDQSLRKAQNKDQQRFIKNWEFSEEVKSIMRKALD